MGHVSLRKTASVGAVQSYDVLYGPLHSLEVGWAAALGLPGVFPTPSL